MGVLGLRAIDKANAIDGSLDFKNWHLILQIKMSTLPLFNIAQVFRVRWLMLEYIWSIRQICGKKITLQKPFQDYGYGQESSPKQNIWKNVSFLSVLVCFHSTFTSTASAHRFAQLFKSQRANHYSPALFQLTWSMLTRIMEFVTWPYSSCCLAM